MLFCFSMIMYLILKKNTKAVKLQQKMDNEILFIIRKSFFIAINTFNIGII